MGISKLQFKIYNL